MMTDFKEGDEIWFIEHPLPTVQRNKIYKHFGDYCSLQEKHDDGPFYFKANSVGKTRNEAINAMIEHLESKKDE